MISRRRLLATAAACSVASLRPARAQQWPTRVIRAIVPFPPGGSVDILARVVAAHVSELWGQQMVVENKPGAGGNIGNEAVAHAEPDGYTVLFTQGGIVVNRFLYPALNYDPVADFAPVSLLLTVPNVLVVPASSSAKSVEELIDKGKAGSLSYGSAGNGTSSHLCGELFKRRAGIKMTHVPYRGTSLVINDLIAGRLDATMDNVSPLLPHIQSGALRALAVTTTQPSAVLPDVKPISQAGLTNFDVAAMVAALLPAKTPTEIITKYHQGIASALAQPDTRQKLEALGSAVIASSPAELARFMEKEAAIWEPVIREGNIKIGD